jgi:Ca2+-binding EF-hand superfamily protein
MRKKKLDLQLRGRRTTLKDAPKDASTGTHTLDLDLEAALANGTDLESLSKEHWKQLHERILENLHGRVDYDKDGRLSLSEMVQYAQQRHFQSAQDGAKDILLSVDRNHDNKLSLKEVSEEWDLLLQADYADLLNSTNATDVELAKTEIEKTKELEKKKFETADKDKDGLLNMTEITAMFYPETDPDTMEVYIQDLIDQHDHDGNGKIGLKELDPGNSSHPAGAIDTHHDFHSLDQDGDGHLDMEELKPWTDGTFSWHKLLSKVLNLADHNSDDHVTLDELRKTSEAHKFIEDWGLHKEL